MEALATIEEIETPLDKKVENDSLYDFTINGLIESRVAKDQIEKILKTESDPNEQLNKLATAVEFWRSVDGYEIPAIDSQFTPFTEESASAYRQWDRDQAKNLLEKYQSLKELETIMPEGNSADPLADTRKIDMEAEFRKEMRPIMPKTPERSAADRYQDLINKATTKAREYEGRDLSDEETRRLNEIRSDIKLFTTKLAGARVAREGFSSLEASATLKPVVETDESTAKIVEITKESKPVVAKKGFWSRLFGANVETAVIEPPARILPKANEADIFLESNRPPSPGLRKTASTTEKTLDLSA